VGLNAEAAPTERLSNVRLDFPDKQRIMQCYAEHYRRLALVEMLIELTSGKKSR